MNDPWAEMRREMERLFGYPKGAFDPASPLLRDAERLNRALGQGFVMFQDVLNPQQLLERIEASMETLGGRETFALPHLFPKPPWTDRRSR